VTAPAWTRWRNAASIGATCLFMAALLGTPWYRATYHMFPGMVPTVVHWCGRDYQQGLSRPQSWAQVTAQAPVAVRAVGNYPPFGPGRLLLADTGNATHRSPGQACANDRVPAHQPGPVSGVHTRGGTVTAAVR
jgi:hypothetical protein